MRQPRKPAKAPYTLLYREQHRDDYKRLDALVRAHHDDLRDARIALAWCRSWRMDTDGKVTLGRCRKASSLDRELHEWDFIILLNQGWWQDPAITDIQRDALLDHELCHATIKVDPETDDPALDERGRIMYRLRRHDVEEFACIAARYGVWKRDLEQFAQSLRRSPQTPLPLEQEKTTSPPAPGPHRVQ